MLFKAYGWQYLALGILKLANDILNFAGPLLLNVLVQYLEQPAVHQDSLKSRRWLPPAEGLSFGLCCTALLGVTSLVKASTALHLCLASHSLQQALLLYTAC